MAYGKLIRIVIFQIYGTLCFKHSSKKKLGLINCKDTDKTSYCILQTSGFIRNQLNSVSEIWFYT
jgi:hypothetical protein